MMLPKGATVAVADGEKLNLYKNVGDETGVKLTALAHPDIDGNASGSETGRHSSSANPNESQAQEDGFSGGVVKILNDGALAGTIDTLVIIAAPRALGEMRKHYHKVLESKLLAEIAKDLTGHSIKDIENTLTASD
jgi:protein required for attachment to host cells